MKTILLLLLSIGLATVADAQVRPKHKVKRAFVHTSEAGKGKNNKARFRRENNIRPTIDLNPRRLEKTKTVKAPKPYKFSNGS
jgi:hypothetical protein